MKLERQWVLTINDNKKGLPIALVEGQPFSNLPEDLFIPPDALKVYLETFEGPLDLLLYLIRKQNFDILNIPVALITKQYLEYIALMKSLKIELAAEYLLMAAILAEIKSRLLLPKNKEQEDIEEDPRAELIRRLQEYELFQAGANYLDELPRIERDNFSLEVMDCDNLSIKKEWPEVSFDELILAFKSVLKQSENTRHHKIERESLSIRQRMAEILTKLSPEQFVLFTSLFELKEGRQGLVVTFIAALELVKQSMLTLVQTEAYGPIHVSLKAKELEND